MNPLTIGFLLVVASGAPAAESGPMSLSLRQPVYRHSLYATQAEQPIAANVHRSEALQSQVAELRGRLLDEHGRELMALKPGLQPADDVRFDCKPLPAGTYWVEVRALDAGGRELAAAKTPVRKLPPSAGSEVRIDEHRNIVIDGKPSVQIGWYGAVRLDDPRPDVLALQNIQTATTINYPDKSPVTTLFREHGIRTMVNLEPGRLLYTFDLWKQPNHPVPTEHTKLAAPSTECREMLRKMVELLKDEPGLFGWYIADEPEINNYRAEYLEAFYHTLRDLDPYHPVVVTNDTLDGLEKFGFRCCDILAPDPYGAKPDYVPSFLVKANSVLRPGQGLMLTPWHAAHHTHFTVEYGTEPPFSYRVMRGQYLVTLAAGGRGFAGYTGDFFLPEPRLRIGLPHLWREVRFLEPFFECGDLSPLSVSVGTELGLGGGEKSPGRHVTHADLPQWIEFAWADAKPLRRIVLYTPNLRDYDLKFRGPDGSVQQAEVRGNTRDVAEHVLPRPTTTLKLRLIARAVGDNPRPPRAMLREIEAYADPNSNGAPLLELAAISAPAEPPAAVAAPAPSAPPLWRDDFASFKHKPKHYEGDPEAWVLNPAEFAASYDAPSKQLRCTVTSPAGYASMSRLLPYAREHRFLQISVPRIQGEGYQWLIVSFGDPSGKAAARPAVHTIKPGRYTVDVHALHDIFRSPDQRQGLLNVYLMKGIAFGLENVSFAPQPTNGLAITLADGSPLPRSLKEGDELLFRLFLDQPATDAIVELQRDSWYEPIRLNGEPYVQLLKSGKEKDGRYWSAVVKLGAKTDKFKVTGYPALFRAAISGGAIQETLSTVLVDME